MTLHGQVPPEPNMIQLLTPEGVRVSHPDFELQITDSQIQALYRDLVLVRRFDGEATALQRQGELGLWASCLGQEAAQVGAGRALRIQDMAFPTYREHGVAWCRDVDPVTLLGMFRGVSLGGWNPNENNFNLYTIVLGAQALHAAAFDFGGVQPHEPHQLEHEHGQRRHDEQDERELDVLGEHRQPLVSYDQKSDRAFSSLAQAPLAR